MLAGPYARRFTAAAAAQQCSEMGLLHSCAKRSRRPRALQGFTEAVRTRSVRTVARPSRAEQLSAEAEQRAAGLESRQLNSARIAAALLKRGEQRANSALSQRETQQPLERAARAR